MQMWADGLIRDGKQALRFLRSDIPLSLCAMALLALGLGATSAIFSIVYGVLLRPLPYRQPSQIVTVELFDSKSGLRNNTADGLRYRFWREHQHQFESLAALSSVAAAVAEVDGRSDRVLNRSVTSEFFRVLGMQPALGGFFAGNDDPGEALTAVLSYGFWKRFYGGNPQVVGQKLVIGSRVYTIIGVAPDQMVSSLAADCWTLLDVATDSRSRGTNYHVIARLKDGTSISQAQADMELVGNQFMAMHHTRVLANESIQVLQYKEAVGHDSQASLLVLMAAAAFVLLIACVNVANLLLARSAARRREIAVRMAVGASRLQIIRQVLAESVALAIAGGLTGLLLAYFAVQVILQLHPVALPRLDEVSLDWPVVFFSLGLTVFTGILFGLAPALHSLSNNIRDSLLEGSSQSSDSRMARGARGLLVVFEFSVSLALLVGTALLLRTFVGLSRIDAGFEPNRLLTMQIALSATHYRTSEQVARFADETLTRVRMTPGVRDAAVTNYLPLGGGINVPLASIAGKPQAGPILGNLQWFGVTPEFFSTMQIPTQQGRLFDARDRASSPPVVIVNEAFVTSFLRGQDPLGRQINIAWSLILGQQNSDPQREIVGVVRNIHVDTLWERPQPTVFVPLKQINDVASQYANQSVPLNLLVRTAADPLLLSQSAITQIKYVDPLVSVFKVRSMEEVLGDSMKEQRFITFLIGSFGLLALGLAAMGIYGVISYAAVRRTRELGIRAALGASPGTIIALVLRQGLTLAALGIAVGSAAAWMLTKSLTSFLFGVTPHDPLSFAVPSLVLLTVALCACLLPARRAAKVDPLRALRHE